MNHSDTDQAKARRGSGLNVISCSCSLSSSAFVCSPLTAWFDGLSQH